LTFWPFACYTGILPLEPCLQHSTLFILLRIVLCSQGISCFLMNSSIDFSVSVKNVIDGHYFESTDCFGIMADFTTLILLIHEHRWKLLWMRLFSWFIS
jgi:hypothetical protein